MRKQSHRFFLILLIITFLFACQNTTNYLEPVSTQTLVVPPSVTDTLTLDEKEIR
jgi:hypothetical protein